MKKKTAIITGGSSGIGLSITEAFVNAGYFVIVGARKKVDLNNKFGKNAVFIKADVRKESSHKLLVEMAKRYHLETTFHRAFDYLTDPKSSLKNLHDLGVNRILCSGSNTNVES